MASRRDPVKTLANPPSRASLTMKKVVFLLLALCFGLGELRFLANQKRRLASGFKDDFSEGTLGDRAALVWTVLTWGGPRLTPDGTYCLTGYLSVPTPSGPVGLLPGQQVRVVRGAGSGVIVTAPDIAGTRELEVPRASLTEDMDLAGHLAARDRTAHREFRTQLEREEATREGIRLGLYKDAAANLAAVERARMAPGSGNGIGGRLSVLHETSKSHGGGSYGVAVPVYYGVPVANASPAASGGRTPPPGTSYPTTVPPTK